MVNYNDITFIQKPMKGETFMKNKKKIFSYIFAIMLVMNSFVISNNKIEAATDYYISWTGTSAPENSKSVSIDNFNSRKEVLNIFYVSGTPVWGTACTITTTATNCTLANGSKSTVFPLDGGNLEQTIFQDITPASSYNGQTVKYAVSIRGGSQTVFYANGYIGQ